MHWPVKCGLVFVGWLVGTVLGFADRHSQNQSFYPLRETRGDRQACWPASGDGDGVTGLDLQSIQQGSQRLTRLGCRLAHIQGGLTVARSGRGQHAEAGIYQWACQF